jgi:hypothetical protein
VRVFTWNTKKHRYETAFRERDLWGYLPVTMTSQTFPEGIEPTFTLHVSSTQDVTIDPQTGMAKPAALEGKQYRLDGEVVKKVVAPSAAAEAKPAAAAKPRVAPARRKRARR